MITTYNFVMDLQQNPLDSRTTDNKIKKNGSGRPSARNSIIFSPQPVSIIAELLSKNKRLQDQAEANKKNVEVIDSQNTSFICQICPHRSADLKNYEQHMNSHKQFTCDFPDCKYSCKLSSNLLKHQRVHTDEKPYLCEKCSFRSNFINSLKVHKRTHTSERPYQCNYCSYKCNSSSNLKKHCVHRHPNK